MMAEERKLQTQLRNRELLSDYRRALKDFRPNRLKPTSYCAFRCR